MKKITGGIIVLIFLFTGLSVYVYAQDVPFYSFVRFDSSYDSIISSAKNEEYEIQESEINSPFGKYLVTIKKPLSYHTEQIYLFFNQDKQLQFFTVRFLLGENQSRLLLDRLATSIIEKLGERYGESEPGAMLYKKLINERYEIIVPPIYAGSRIFEVSFKDLERYSSFQQFYEAEMKAKEDEEIATITGKF